MAGAVRRGDGPGRGPLRPGGPSPAGQGVRPRPAFGPCHARTAGRSPSTPGIPARTGCSTCLPGRCGTRTRSATTCAPARSSTWARTARCWWWTKPGTSRRAPRPWGAAPVHRHRRPGGERPGRGLPGVRHRRRARAGRPGAVPARLWTRDPERLRAAGIPDRVGFATKPELAAGMITRAQDAGVPARWAAGDEVYGANPGLRTKLEACRVGYVLAVAYDHCVEVGGAVQRADALPRQVPARAWQQVSCGKGAKGHRHYEWVVVRLNHREGCAWRPSRPALAAGPPQPQDRRAGLLPLLHTPGRCRWPSWSGLPGGAGRSKSASRTGKGLCGLDQHQVRRWRSRTAGLRWRCWPTPSWSWPRLPTRPRACAARADEVDLQRGPAPVRGTARPSRRWYQPPVALVAVATPAPGPRAGPPLPATSRLATMKITIYGCRIGHASKDSRRKIGRRPRR